MIRLLPLLCILLLPACDGQSVARSEFMGRLSQLCGKAYEGTIVSTDPQDDDWRAERIIMHVRDCNDDEIRIPLYVGEDASRTWILHDEGGRLALRHDHRHEDGTPDAITMYGGAATDDGNSGSRQNFPADEATKEIFDREGIPESKQNIWAIEVRPVSNLFAYEMARPGRYFRIEFDTSTPVDPPAAAD
ncbi:hypothetical protein [Aquisalinus flavus]|uniref:Secreted protein n=1 Tax=Aquisalinus flavus TaxID=1526572 RepID=A0A8J2Y4P8_9PROT|nr:hypothetical protein [Aquisalinus flavus]MBD0427216.1 hypothetical protein [Aquisalinus flavus]UNE47031.1 hypothetical protein FF099_02645 [Aquisalinus flavus]GGC99266.1 hypothetical protein GCM10011342_05300 [Aquisalinus flavus]